MPHSFDQSSSAVITAAAVVAGMTAVAATAGYFVGRKFHQLEAMSSQLLPRSTSSNVNVKMNDSKSLVDVRIAQIRPLVPPGCILEEIANTGPISATVNYGRQSVANVIHGLDDRLVVIVGPCSIHDTQAALEYGQRLKKMHDELKADLHIIMRVYFEKPRTTIG